MAWMGELKGASGKLVCGGYEGRPCGLKLGQWSWTGNKCGCGEWIAPALHVAKSKVDAFQTKAAEASESAKPSEELGVSLQWMKLSPPPAVVVFMAHGSAGDARAAVERLWGGRFVTEGTMAWLFVSTGAAPATVARLLAEISDRGVPSTSIFLGGVGHGQRRLLSRESSSPSFRSAQSSLSEDLPCDTQ